MIAHNKVTFFLTEWIQSNFEVAKKIQSHFVRLRVDLRKF